MLGLVVAGGVAVLAGAVFMALRTPAPGSPPRPRRKDSMVPAGGAAPPGPPKVQPAGADAKLLEQTFTLQDVEAAARMIASENRREGELLKVEQLWAELRAKRRSESLFDRITKGQGWGVQNKRRPVATGTAPTDAERELVWEVLRGNKPSTLPGARKYFEPEQEDRIYRQVTQARADLKAGKTISPRSQQLIAAGYGKTADEVRQDWAVDGARMVGVVGPVEFWT